MHMSKLPEFSVFSIAFTLGAWAQAAPKPEIRFDPATATVTVEMQVRDPDGHFIPNIHRDNFAIYENGVRQPNAAVEVRHAPVSLAVLMEWGGRYQTLTK